MELSNVALLTSSNWETWKVEEKVLPMHFGAWNYIENPDSDVEVKENSESSDQKDADGKTVPVTDQLTWRERSEMNLHKARSYTIIYHTLSPEFKPLIAGTTSGAAAWKILKHHFEPTTRARVIQLLDEFFNVRYVPSENLGLFLYRVKQAAERLREVGHTLQPLYLGYQMIRSLPEEFHSTVQAIYRWPDAEFVPDKIESELLLEENRLKLAKRDLADNNVAFTGEITKCKTGDSDDESETSISSVHTSDLSSFDDEISLSSDNENGEKKTIPLKEALKKYSVTDHKLSRDHIKLEVKSVNPKAPIRIVKKVVPKTKTGSSFSSKQSSAAPTKTIQKTIIVKKGVPSLKSQTSQHTIDPSKTSEKIAIKVVKNVAKPKPPIPEKKVVKKNSDGIKTRKNKSGGMRKVTVKPNEKKETSSSSKTPIRIVKKVVPKTKTGSSFSSKQSSAAPTKTIQKTIIGKKGVPSLITLSSNSEDESYKIHPDDGRMPIHSGPSTHNQTESPVPAKKKLVGPVSLEDYTGDNIKNSLLNAVQLIESWLPVSEVENSNELIGMFLFRQIISPNDTNHHCLLCTSKNTFRYLLDLEKHYCIVHELASQSSKAEISKNIIFVSKAPDVTEQTSLNSECRYCDIKLKNIEEVRSHYFTIHNRVVRVVPEQQVKELSSSIFCSICSEMSKNFTEHHTHMKNVHQYQIYMCKYCNFIASQSNRLKTHIKQKHPQATSPQPSTVVEKGSKVKLKCPVCWLFINGKEHLDQHVLLAHAVQTGSEICCPKCLQPCGTSKDFIVHVFSCVAPKIDDQSQKSDGHYEKKTSFLKNSRERYREKERASKYLEKDKFTSKAPKRKNSVGSSSSSEFSDSN